MRYPDNTALGMLFTDVRKGYTLYGAFARLVEKGFITIPSGTLRQNFFASKKIKSFGDIAALIDETFGSDALKRWLLEDQTFRPMDPEASILKGLKALAIAAGTPITETELANMKAQAKEMVNGYNTAYEVVVKKNFSHGNAKLEAKPIESLIESTDNETGVMERSTINTKDPALENYVVVDADYVPVEEGNYAITFGQEE